MNRVCPQCGRESPVESDFCPACGAPMDAHVLAGQEKAASRAQDHPPMKWHRFLTWVSIPLGLIMTVVSLVTAVQDLSGFDASLYKPEFVSLVRFSLYLDVCMSIVTLPLLAGAEYGLLKQKWLGVRLILLLYTIQFVYALLMLILFLRLNVDLLEVVASAVSSGLMLALTLMYYRKRRKLFSPDPDKPEIAQSESSACS